MLMRDPPRAKARGRIPPLSYSLSGRVLNKWIISGCGNLGTFGMNLQFISRAPPLDSKGRTPYYGVYMGDPMFTPDITRSRQAGDLACDMWRFHPRHIPLICRPLPRGHEPKAETPAKSQRSQSLANFGRFQKLPQD